MDIFRSKLKLNASILIAVIGFPLTTASPANAYDFYPYQEPVQQEVQSYKVPSYPAIQISRDTITTAMSSGWTGGRYKGDIVDYARTFVNRVPYVAFAADPSVGFDCSGFIQFLYKSSLDINLPHSADSQARMGTRVKAAEARAGDWVWWPNEHIGLYIGHGQMIDSPNDGQMVSEHAVWGDPIYIRFNS